MFERPLYNPVIWPCACCGLPREFTFLSQTDQVVCQYCKRHGPDTVKVLRLHRDWWQQYLDHLDSERVSEAQRWKSANDQLKQTIAERDTRIAEMRSIALRGYEETPMGGIRLWLQNELVREAEGQRNAAFRSRDRVLRSLWQISQIHHESQDGRHCSCGIALVECREYDAIASANDLLRRWERKQVELLEAGKVHNLPDNHPKVRRTRQRGWVA